MLELIVVKRVAVGRLVLVDPRLYSTSKMSEVGYGVWVWVISQLGAGGIIAWSEVSCLTESSLHSWSQVCDWELGRRGVVRTGQ
jgi:ABC-type thiamine transport system substrate-binding protein